MRGNVRHVDALKNKVDLVPLDVADVQDGFGVVDGHGLGEIEMNVDGCDGI